VCDSSSIQPRNPSRYVCGDILRCSLWLAEHRPPWEGERVIAAAPVGPETLAEVRRWLLAVDALTEAVNSTQNLRTILDLVASSARTLLGFDFCAVLLPDVSGANLVITGWSGLSADYVARVNADRPVRLTTSGDMQAPSSKAFNSGRPVAIADIAGEPEFTPWGGVAREQGYRAMVSVPLIAGGVAVGTLNGYHAAVHEFTDHERERLTLLANHAAIALTSARLVEQLQSLNDSLRRQRDLLTKSEQIHQQLLAVALRGGGMAGIVTVLSGLVSRPVLVDDGRGAALAQAGPPVQWPTATTGPGRLDEEPGTDRLRSVVGGPFGDHQLADQVEPVTVVNPDGPSFVVWPVRLAVETVARILLPGVVDDFSPIDRRAIEHASIVISLEIVRLRTGIEVEHRLRGELLADILGGTAADSAALRQRAELLGHNLTLPHVAIVGRIDMSAASRQAAGYQRALNIVGALAGRQHPAPLVAMHRGQLVVLWPTPGDSGGAERRSVIRRTADDIRRAMASIPGVAAATVAVSGTGHRNYPQAYRTARGALDVAIRGGRSNVTITLDDLGVSGLLLQLDDPDQLLEFAEATLAQVRRHDEQRGTQLVETLRSYLGNQQSRSETAKALHVHPNTVSQRLQRIETLTGLDLLQPASIVQVRAALMLLDIAEATDPLQGNISGASPAKLPS
jgi:sugar diacid utilization regulator